MSQRCNSIGDDVVQPMDLAFGLPKLHTLDTRQPLNIVVNLEFQQINTVNTCSVIVLVEKFIQALSNSSVAATREFEMIWWQLSIVRT